jgi:hypothetical protein
LAQDGILLTTIDGVLVDVGKRRRWRAGCNH